MASSLLHRGRAQGAMRARALTSSDLCACGNPQAKKSGKGKEKKLAKKQVRRRFMFTAKGLQQLLLNPHAHRAAFIISIASQRQSTQKPVMRLEALSPPCAYDVASCRLGPRY